VRTPAARRTFERRRVIVLAPLNGGQRRKRRKTKPLKPLFLLSSVVEILRVLLALHLPEPAR